METIFMELEDKLPGQLALREDEGFLIVPDLQPAPEDELPGQLDYSGFRQTQSSKNLFNRA